jgi:hypothetical protein
MVRRTAWLWCELNHSLPLYIGAHGTLLLRKPSQGGNRPGLVPVRGRYQTGGRGELALGVLVPGGPGSYNPDLKESAAAREALQYRVELDPGEGMRSSSSPLTSSCCLHRRRRLWRRIPLRRCTARSRHSGANASPRA